MPQRTLAEELDYWEGDYHYPKGLLRSAATRIRNLEEQVQDMDKPSVGRIVHYVAYGTPGGEFPAGVCRAAVITEVGVPLSEGVLDEHPYVGLCVLNPTGQFFNRGIPYDPDKKPGSWHWAERV